MADLDELEYKLIVGARRTRVVVYEEHGAFANPYSREEPDELADADYQPPPEMERLFSVGQPDGGAVEQAGSSEQLSHGSKYANYNYAKRMKTRRQTFSELVYNNFEPPNTSMITLTFDKKRCKDMDLQDLDVTHKEFKKFIQRMNFRFDNFKYVASFSRQKSRNWHYHIICNIGNSTSKAQIESIWNCGHIWLTYIFKESTLREKVEYCLDNMGQIALKDLKREKGYLASKGLRRNLVLRSWDEKEMKAAEELFNQIKDDPHTLLYSTSRHKGAKIKYGPESSQTYYLERNPVDGTDEEEWRAKTHYLSSSTKFKQLFPLLPEAKLKKPQQTK